MTLPSPPPKAVSRGGLVFTVEDRRFFLGAELVVRVAPRPHVTRFPGAPPGLLGLALSDGAIVPVLELGPERGAMIVCVYRGEQIGLVGADDIASGMFTADGDVGVVVANETVPPLGIEELYARVHAVTWGAGWGG
jgi:CheW-like domain